MPTAEHDAPEWQASMQGSLLVAELDGPTIFARIPKPRNESPNRRVAYFVRIHETLRTTPAMATGVTKRLWEIGDIVDVLEAWEAAA